MPRVQRQDLVVEARESPLMLADDLRLERSVAVARHFDYRLAEVAFQRLRADPVARVAAPASRRGVLLVAQVVAQLGVHRPFH